jgi:hypothetical protein
MPPKFEFAIKRSSKTPYEPLSTKLRDLEDPSPLSMDVMQRKDDA